MDPNHQPTGPQEPPLTAQLAQQLPPRPPGRRPGSLGRWLLLLVVLVLFGSLLLNVVLFGMAGLASLSSLDSQRRIQEEYHSLQKDGHSKVAIISIVGTITDGEGYAKRQIDRVMEDDSVKAVVLRVDSPGGTMTGSDYLYHHLCRLAEKREIPIVVSMGGLAASGGYYVSMAAGDQPDAIFAEPTTWTGSIGVIMPQYDLSGLLTEKLGIVDQSVLSHPLKDMGSLIRPMTEEEHGIFKELVDESFGHFKEVVKAGRPEFRKDPEALDKLATGQVYTASQALENGLIDKIGFIEDAIDRAIELAKLDKSDVKVVQYNPTPTLADVLLGGETRSPQPDLAAILDLSAPRAYYLCTRLPLLMSSHKP
jgi:protease-4